jgi:hypothetical protein
MLSEPLGVEKSTRVRPNVWPINSSISVIWKHEARATSHAPAEAFPIMSVYRKWTLPHGLCTTHTLSIAYRDHPVWRSRREEAKRGPPSGHRITRNGAAMVLLLLPYATTGLSRIAWWCGDWCNPSRSAADACVVYSPQALRGVPSAPRITAQRVARFDHYRASNFLPLRKLR